ncbi:hypothetical protein CO038_03475 [Candidatus Pacearchaeota archaeon CG_4_9_14_0_2_um_filter_39_13]|nr:hypothetical protein [Candidatus Pacearchaeota archaeon]OIO43596.1 MAG: hypothetical protein AUJ64_01960 [Candidatus Pacearchaeota archaeon CG1_02_39_14]PJC44478.1 MAG: hypothetical protein CO038_03475 [Candidatus Pacearchaeota archaeon CG_4_9_14_0_2_um_filter_39_13]
MPNQCIHCSEIYGDGSEEVLKGCSKCGSRFFFYISEDKLKKIRESSEEEIKLSSEEKRQIEEDVRDIVGIKEDEAPIVMDFESVKVLKPGKYLLDIQNLFSKERPLVYKLEDGKYIVDLVASLNRSDEKTI